MSMGIECYILTEYGSPWYSFLIVLFILLVVLFGLGFTGKLVIDFLRKRKDRIDEGVILK